ncbi:hypothetical protein [Lacihabitans sp. CCS-44]|uniref:hypothetical protein n=1 Tax=Lacihabitans sp. CCS-44 TaxID=2487331 RepID=UPI0020CC4A4B|nr:hypothetical protein [Lacihabitans sp. CCS-44]
MGSLIIRAPPLLLPKPKSSKKYGTPGAPVIAEDEFILPGKFKLIFFALNGTRMTRILRSTDLHRFPF